MTYTTVTGGCGPAEIAACDADVPGSCIRFWRVGPVCGHYVDRDGTCHELRNAHMPFGDPANVGDLVDGTFTFLARHGDRSWTIRGRFRACYEEHVRAYCE